MKESTLYTLNPFGKKIDLEQLSQQSFIKSKNVASKIESLIYINSEPIYEISTKTSSVVLSENSMLSVGSGFKLVSTLLKDENVYCNDALEPITAIKIKPTGTIILIDNYDGSSYNLNGFTVTNPVFIPKFERKFLNKPSEQKQSNKYIDIDGMKYFFKIYDGLYLIDNSFTLDSLTSHKITLYNAKSIIVSYMCDSEVIVKYIKEQHLEQSDGFLLINFQEDENHFELKSKDKLTVKQIFVK